MPNTPDDRAEVRAAAFAEMTGELLAGAVPAPRDTIRPTLTAVFRACLDRDHPDFRPFTPPAA